MIFTKESFALIANRLDRQYTLVLRSLPLLTYFLGALNHDKNLHNE